LNGQPHVARVIALDFYDGAAGGFLELINQSKKRGWYRYELISWATDHFRRVFCAAPAPAVDRILTNLEEAQSRFWTPDVHCSIGDELNRLRKQRPTSQPFFCPMVI
jgi:hypothetical protein